jgi:adenosylcobyric acid synthase
VTGPSRALLVCGTASGVGKSTVVAGLCRLLARSGSRVAPFKAQNMSNHAAVTVDGGEIGRAQAAQAAAAGVEPEIAMNPLLLKPIGERDSRLVVLGHERGTSRACDGEARAAELRPIVLDAWRSLRARFDTVVAEGAGGAAEINLLARDVVNLPFAAAAGIPAVVVVDIDRGGAFAAALGTLELLPPALAVTVQGFVINRFRGDPALLDPGIAVLERRTGVPVLGVLPWLAEPPRLQAEDSLDLDGWSVERHGSAAPLRVAVVHLPHLANPSDLDPLLGEPDVELTWATRPAAVLAADVVVVPGTRATVADLAWLRGRGLDDALARTPATVLGLCGGYQMLGRRIVDHVESGAGTVAGLGLLPVETEFAVDKVVRRRSGRADGRALTGYEIRFGRPRRLPDAAHDLSDGSAPTGDAGWLVLDDPGWLVLDDEHGCEVEGCRSADGRVLGTSLHGILDADDVRAAFLLDAARRHGRTVRPSPVPFAARLAAQHDRLADWLAAHLDVDGVLAIAARAAAPGTEPGWPVSSGGAGWSGS